MAEHPSQIVTAGLARDLAVLRDARRTLTIADEPRGPRDRLAYIMHRDHWRGYAAIRNERAIRTDARLGRLRRELVQWSTQHAPPAIGGYHDLLMWALAEVDWPMVARGVGAAPEPRMRPVVMTPHPA